MYRTHRFPLEWLQQQLAAPGSSNSALYSNLEQLLAFLNLPGSVVDWLPVKKMTLRHVKAMKFYHTAAAMQAVDDMLGFAPLFKGNSSSTLTNAVFLVTTTQHDARLLVRSLRIRSPGLSEKILQATHANLSAQPSSSATLHDYGSNETTSYIFDVFHKKRVTSRGHAPAEVAGAGVAAVGADVAAGGADVAAVGADVAAAGADDSDWGPVPPAAELTPSVSAKHSVFGAPLKDAVLAAASSCGLCVGTARIRTHAGNTESNMVDIWVFSW